MDEESPTTVQTFHAACVAAAEIEPTTARDRWYEILDKTGSAFGVAPRLMMLHAVKLLPRITATEIAAHPGLAVAHWLVLADLIPEAGPYRTTWTIRCEQMRFTPKILRSELQAGLAALAREQAAEAAR